MKLGITGSRDIKLFNPLGYLTVKEINFRRFCCECGYPECEVSDVITTDSVGVDEMVHDWAFGFGYCVFVYSVKPHIPDSYLEAVKQIINDCDIMVFVQDGKSPLPAEALNYARELNKPVYLITEFLPENKKHHPNLRPGR